MTNSWIQFGWLAVGLTAAFIATVHAIQRRNWIWLTALALSSFLGAAIWIGLIYLISQVAAGDFIHEQSREQTNPEISIERWRRIRALEKLNQTSKWEHNLEELSELFEDENHLISAEKYALEAIQLNPNNSSHRYRLARILCKRQQFARAETELHPWIETGSNQPAMLRLYAEIVEKLNRLETSLEIWRSLALENEQPIDLFHTARMQYRLGQIANAVQTLQLLVNLEPINVVYKDVAENDQIWIEAGKRLLSDISLTNKLNKL